MSLIYDITTSLEANRGPVFSKHKYDVGSLIREVSGGLWKLASEFVYSETSWWHSDIVLFDVRQRVRSVLSYSSSVVMVHQLFWHEPPAVSRCTGNYFPLPPTYIPVPGLKTSSSPLHMSVTSLSSASHV